MTTAESASSSPAFKRQKLDASQNPEGVEWRLYHPKRQKLFHVGDRVLVLNDDGEDKSNSSNAANSTLVRRGTVVSVEKREIQVSLASDVGEQKEVKQETFARKEWKR